MLSLKCAPTFFILLLQLIASPPSGLFLPPLSCQHLPIKSALAVLAHANRKLLLSLCVQWKLSTDRTHQAEVSTLNSFSVQCDEKQEGWMGCYKKVSKRERLQCFPSA